MDTLCISAGLSLFLVQRLIDFERLLPKWLLMLPKYLKYRKRINGSIYWCSHIFASIFRYYAWLGRICWARALNDILILHAFNLSLHLLFTPLLPLATTTGWCCLKIINDGAMKFHRQAGRAIAWLINRGLLAFTKTFRYFPDAALHIEAVIYITAKQRTAAMRTGAAFSSPFSAGRPLLRAACCVLIHSASLLWMIFYLWLSVSQPKSPCRRFDIDCRDAEVNGHAAIENIWSMPSRYSWLPRISFQCDALTALILTKQLASYQYTSRAEEVFSHMIHDKRSWPLSFQCLSNYIGWRSI